MFIYLISLAFSSTPTRDISFFALIRVTKIENKRMIKYMGVFTSYVSNYAKLILFSPIDILRYVSNNIE